MVYEKGTLKAIFEVYWNTHPPKPTDTQKDIALEYYAIGAASAINMVDELLESNGIYR